MKRTIKGGKRRRVGKPALTAVAADDRRSRARAMPPGGAEGPVSVAWCSSFVVETIEHLHRFQSLARECAKHPARKPVHELRVEARRLLARIEVLSFLLPRDVWAKGRRAVKKQLKASRSLRDAQVQRRQVRRLLADHPELEAFARHLKRREVRTTRAAREEIARPKQIRRLVRLQQVLERSLPLDAATESEGRAAARRVLQQARARMRRVESAASDSDAASLHRLRIAVKASRYLGEGLQSMRPGFSAASLEQLRERQARLGRVHDRALLQARWDKFARRHEPSGGRERAGRAALAGARQREG